MTETPSMTAVAFVDAHAEEVPAALVNRVRAILAADAKSATLPAAEALLRASTTLLGAVLADESAGRDVALDLLAADACVTWAFEAAAGNPAALPAQAERAMQTIAELAK